MSHLTPVPSDPDELAGWLAAREPAPGQPDAAASTEVTTTSSTTTAEWLTVKLVLEDTEPPVWRRVVVPGDLTLDRVHDVIQSAMGWSDSHLHRFYSGLPYESPYFVTQQDLDEGEDGTRETDARLDHVLRAVGDRMQYEYDFGDGWGHRLELEEIRPSGAEERARCVAGELACPPEDVGGIPGYADMAAWVRAGRPADDVPPPFESAERANEWLPLDWHPDLFDLEETDLLLQSALASGHLLEKLRPEAMGALLNLSSRHMAQISGWLAHAAQTDLSAHDLEELTRPYRLLLGIVGDGVELSASGYLPPGVVKELCVALDIDPIMAGKANRESNIASLASFRKVAQQVGLLHVSRRLLSSTTAAMRHGDDPAGLWRHVASRLPTGRGELQRDVGWFALLALAGGVPRDEVYTTVHQLCVDAGWEAKGGEPMASWDVNPLVWPTLTALLGGAINSRSGSPDWLPAAAASVVFLDQ